MKRFYFNDDEDGEEEEDRIDDSMFMVPDATELIAMTQFENANQQILNCSIKICENSFFWRFYKVSSKLKMIGEVFESLMKLMEGPDDAQI
jgi:hypothetical protein